MDLRVQFPDPAGYPDWKEWANQLNASLERMLQPTPEDQYPIIGLADVKPVGTDGGAYPTVGWITRALNTEIDPMGICLLQGNAFTVPRGRYLVRASAPMLGVDRFKTRLWNVTAGETALIGSTEYSSAAVNEQARSFVVGLIEPKDATVYRLEQFGVVAQAATWALGASAGGGEVEVYSQIELWGLA